MPASIVSPACLIQLCPELPGTKTAVPPAATVRNGFFVIRITSFPPVSQRIRTNKALQFLSKALGEIISFAG
ncbi:hypothetical protein FAEPRAA2165_01273 [Faecalibacterium duncaniae]|uniref:Uncharacterized protein n=1 Tax=Faecalibacterium duncaniae (strain DSM 17677 / JCM 31915 / A2-165) TaxID=411483 RepID=C7H4Q9_FAED2|nr:hypothetical protein FAEPRAA2165_01273 [Faecalibacterium duncaniae]